MNRRTFLKLSGAVPAAAVFAPGAISIARAQQKDFTPRPGTWRTYATTLLGSWPRA